MRLFKLELEKEFKKKETYIIVLLLIILSFLVVLVTNKSSIIYNQVPLLDDVSNNGSMYLKYLSSVNNHNIIANYLQSHPNKAIFILEKSYTLILFLSFICSISSGCLISKEYESGVIKNIVNKYNKRYKYITTKVLVSLMLTTIWLLTLIFSMLFFTMAITKTNLISLYYPKVSNGNIVFVRYLYHFFKNSFISAIPLYFISIISLMFSYCFKKSFISVIITSLLCVFGPVVSNVLLSINIKCTSYTFLSYLDYSMFINTYDLYLKNLVYNTHISLFMGNIVLLASSILIVFMMVYSFIKSDISKYI